jgi:hypothetical protein
MKNGLLLGESIYTFDPAVALRGESGTFCVITPTGEELLITCKPGNSIASVEWADHHEKKPFTVTKISEPVPVAENTLLRKTG